MRTESLNVKMLGSFSLESGQMTLDDSANRSKKVWLLLAYLVYNRDRTVSQEELVELLWGEEEKSSNPLNALKTMLHRVRTMLNQLGSSAGHELIVRKGGSYGWNNEVPMELDVEQFELLFRQGQNTEDEDQRLDCWLQALELYSGDFLVKLGSERWVMPISVYYHNLYLHVVLETLDLLTERGRKDEVVDLCYRVLKTDAYQEDIYRHLIRSLLDLNRQKEAVSVYDEMGELFFSNFGVMPAEDIRAMYREAAREVNDTALPMGIVREQLKEVEPPSGALICEYDFFKMLYHAEARFISRTGDAIHIGLLSLRGKEGKELSKRSLEKAMDNLQEQIRINLRKGDVASRCSVSQYILMLPQANYENSCMVCQRIIRAFYRQYPHSPAEIHYSVQPLEPCES